MEGLELYKFFCSDLTSLTEVCSVGVCFFFTFFLNALLD